MNEILKNILAAFPRTDGQLETTAMGKPVILIKTDHGKADHIGQFALSHWPKQVYTYSTCHEFRQAHLAIYFN
jgi:hypothetical protein